MIGLGKDIADIGRVATAVAFLLLLPVLSSCTRGEELTYVYFMERNRMRSRSSIPQCMP
jgi:hypothetical protein